MEIDQNVVNCSAGFSGFSKPGLSSNTIPRSIGRTLPLISDSSISPILYAKSTASSAQLNPTYTANASAFPLFRSGQFYPIRPSLYDGIKLTRPENGEGASV